MRTKLALKNTIASLLLEIVMALSGIIVPRFFTTVYGSAVNGLVSSISQFITYMGLVEAGVSAAGIVELYKPLANKDCETISGIVSGVKKFYLKSGIIFVALDILLIVAYPYIVRNEIRDLSFIRMMILVLSVSGVVDYFILGKYRVLLMADQRSYVISFFQIVGTVITMVVSIVLIEAHTSAVLVKGVVAIVYVLRTLAVVVYVKTKYKYLDLKAEPLKTAFGQKSSAFFHQIVGMICNNTDVLLLTLLLKENALIEVSIYSVYNYVALALTSFFSAISTGIRASFGQIIAENQTTILRNSYDLFEFIYIILIFTIYTCMAVLLYPFIYLYSMDFSDSSIYPRWSLVIVFTLCGLIQNLRIPGATVQIAAGHFRQTQRAAVIEAVLNIAVSILLIYKFGIIGVLVGTCVSYAYRTTYILVYHERHFLPGTLKKTAARMMRALVVSLMMGWCFLTVVNPAIQSWFQWIISGFITFFVIGGCLFVINAVFEPENLKKSLEILMNMVRKERTLEG